ncbi:Hypothetical protein PENO1_008130 [Penicillium occitanis (nom. inval.)]|nr:Hypothetical protein PENO1_008130 [Penicillium occitanis (nom. inval.)]PCH10074.1 hypothetical protein PENOC_004770 [Penicillium occitanis (nom. inval.)]
MNQAFPSHAAKRAPEGKEIEIAVAVAVADVAIGIVMVVKVEVVADMEAERAAKSSDSYFVGFGVVVVAAELDWGKSRQGVDTVAPVVGGTSLLEESALSLTAPTGLASEALLGSGVGKDVADTAQSGLVAFVEGGCMSVSEYPVPGVTGDTGAACVERAFVGPDE